ncbi:MAG: flagellar hook-length control protein FliK, partial [Dechloromonas sp.]|nr:flagellar hook-length control protein FliK [Dechloromonas sp.]
QLEPGDIVSARIEAKLPDGNFKVLVAGQRMSMALPSYVAPGDTLKLTFVAREPRLTFALNEASQTAPALSPTGRLVAAVLAAPGQPANAPTVSTASPLLAALPGDGTGLTTALKDALGQSGLFYEAHQAEWVTGKRDLVQLRLEPQARLVPGEPHQAARLSPSAPQPEKGLTPGTPAPAAGAMAAGVAPDSVPGAAQPVDQVIHPRTLPVVQQQLAALDTGRVVLQLEVWPKQWMEWEIEEREPDSPRAPDALPDWQMRVRLDLPHLGEISAALRVHGDALRVEVSANSPRSATLLQENRAALEASLAAAGVPPAAIVIAARHAAP